LHSLVAIDSFSIGCASIGGGGAAIGGGSEPGRIYAGTGGATATGGGCMGSGSVSGSIYAGTGGATATGGGCIGIGGKPWVGGGVVFNGGATAMGVPHLSQNLDVSDSIAPHCTHISTGAGGGSILSTTGGGSTRGMAGVPHFSQKLSVAEYTAPQRVQD